MIFSRRDFSSFKTSRWLFIFSVVLILCVLLLFAYPYAHPRSITSALHITASPQLPSQIELACPAGFQPLPGGTVGDGGAKDPFGNSMQRQWLCVDFFGNVNIQGLAAAPGVGGGPGGGTGGGGGGGGTGTGPTGASNNCLATTVLQGYACMGPPVTASGANPSFESNFTNVLSSSPGGSALSVTGNPIIANSSALIWSVNTGGGAINVPSGFTSITNVGGAFLLAEQNLSSTNSISPNVSYAGTAGAIDYLFFVGGAVSSTATQNVSGSGGTCTAPAFANEQCSVITMGAVSASHFLLVACKTTGAASLAKSSATDTLGEGYTNLGAVSVLNNVPAVTFGANLWLVQNPIAGSPVITVHSGESTVIPACSGLELSGQTPYFVGTQGPPNFRAIQQSDLPPFINGFVAYGQNTLSGNVTVTGSLTTIQSVTIRTPQNGCPCRALIMYSGWANFAGVTNEPDIDFFVSDGTTNMIPFTSGQSNASTGAETTVSASGISDVTYAGGTSVTFTLKGIVSSVNAGTIQFVYQAAQPTGGSGANAYLKVAFVPSAQ